MDEKKYCKSCGAEVPRNAKYCARCGNEFYTNSKTLIGKTVLYSLGGAVSFLAALLGFLFLWQAYLKKKHL